MVNKWSKHSKKREKNAKNHVFWKNRQNREIGLHQEKKMKWMRILNENPKKANKFIKKCKKNENLKCEVFG